ncbi:MAG: hypothetical protein KKD18_01695 [Nanoarchaeota archaeon]|nr:hypothetical protein [Nanoarchaeota archaeon]MBU0977107.1 hypothetical protein [Nanoarchaeota archaeon]
MRSQKFILLGFLLIFLAANVSALSLCTSVSNSQYPYDPISGATVRVELLEGSHPTWTLITNANGDTSPCASTTLSTGTHYFKLDSSATGFQDWNQNNVPLTINPIETTYRFPQISLTPVSTTPKACNDNADNDGDGKCDFDGAVGSPGCDGTPDPGCTSADDNDEYNAPAPPSSGIVVDVKIKSGHLSVECDEGYTEEGRWSPVGFPDDPEILCVKYVSPQITGQIQILEKVYLSQASGDHWCEMVDGVEDVRGTNFPGGGEDPHPFVLCKRYATRTDQDVMSKQYVFKARISQTGCGTTPPYQLQSTQFFDNDAHTNYLCTGLANYQQAQGDCILSNPKWINRDNKEIDTITGWFEPDQNTYQCGELELYLQVQATGCYNDNIDIQVNEGDKTSNFESFNPYQSFTIPATVNRQGAQGDIAYFHWLDPLWFEKTEPEVPLDGDRYLYFKASVGTSQETDWSKKLTVKKPDKAECTNDAQCEVGEMCNQCNKCVDFSCDPEEPDSCSDGKYCDDEADPPTCVECLTDRNCQENPVYGDLAEYFKCNMASKTCYSTLGCQFTKWSFTDAKNNQEISSAMGWINNNREDYVLGTNVIITGEASGCEPVSDLVFVVIEEDDLIIFTTESKAYTLPATAVSNSRFFVNINSWQPDWYPSFEHFFGGLLGGKNSFEYRVYAASASNLNKPFEVKSEILTVTQPPIAECHFSQGPAIADAECPAGERCSEGNRCVEQCTIDSDCENGALCATAEKAIDGAILGSCYQCFADTDCASQTDGKKYCTDKNNDKPFTCVACLKNSDCPSQDNKPGICSKTNTCTASCDPANGNSDCSSFALSAKTREEIRAITDLTARAATKGKDVCDQTDKVCVQCTDNYNPREPDSHCQGNSCCPEGTACKVEGKKCVECIEDSICGSGRHCDTTTNKCIGGINGGALFGGVGGSLITELLGALIGFFAMGPTGAGIGALIGSSLGGSGGGTLGGLGDLFGGLGGLFGIILQFI